MANQPTDDKIVVRGYISPGSDPLVWPWVHANQFVKNQLSTTLVFGCETYLRLEAMGVQPNPNAPLDASMFVQKDVLADSEGCRRYTPSLLVSRQVHPLLHQHLSKLKDSGATPSELNHSVIHIFECWLLAFWARTTGNAISNASPEGQERPQVPHIAPPKTQEAPASASAEKEPEKAKEGEGQNSQESAPGKGQSVSIGGADFPKEPSTKSRGNGSGSSLLNHLD